MVAMNGQKWQGLANHHITDMVTKKRLPIYVNEYSRHKPSSHCRVGYCSPMTAQSGSDHWWHKWVEYSRYTESRCNPLPCRLPNKDMTHQLINHSCFFQKVPQTSCKLPKNHENVLKNVGNPFITKS